MTDEQMVAGCLKGDPIAQKALYQVYARKMMSICMRYAPNSEQAQDILQDGFVKVFQKMDHFRGDGPLGGWIARTMVNTALDQIRAQLGPYRGRAPPRHGQPGHQCPEHR